MPAHSFIQGNAASLKRDVWKPKPAEVDERCASGGCENPLVRLPFDTFISTSGLMLQHLSQSLKETFPNVIKPEVESILSKGSGTN